MPYSMLHLFIGQRLLPELSIADAGAFLLGCVAPDAVHFHPNYVSEFKRISHFVPDGIAWGDCREEANPIWLNNVRDFLRESCSGTPRDFALGYASHVIQDIYNNMTLWTPLRHRAEAECRPELLERYRMESIAVDRALHCRGDEVLSRLSRARAMGIPGRVEAEDVERLRQSLLADPHAGQPMPDLSAHQCLTEATVESFLRDAADFTLEQLRR